MITLGALVLPDGLIWADEYAWTPVAQQAEERTLTGALVVEEAIKTGGRPITLKGQQDGNGSTAWLLRQSAFRGHTSLEALRAALHAAEATLDLTLHDGRRFRVTPRQDGEGPLKVAPRPVYGNSVVLADPDADTRYFVEEIRLMEIPA